MERSGNGSIKINGLKKSFGKGELYTEVLKGVDFQMEAGDFCAVMGASGCGKSTLMNIFCGLDSADEGECLVNGKDIRHLKDKELAQYRNREIGIVFQGFYLDETRNLLENVEMPLGYSGVKKKERRKRAEELLEEFGLSVMKKKRPSQVSGGEQQRAAIARAIINRPGILFADEPTGNLDEDNTRKVMELLTDLNKKGMGILIVTHDDYVASFAKRVIMIEHGKIKDGR